MCKKRTFAILAHFIFVFCGSYGSVAHAVTVTDKEGHTTHLEDHAVQVCNHRTCGDAPRFRSWAITLGGGAIPAPGPVVNIEYLPVCHHGIRLMIGIPFSYDIDDISKYFDDARKFIPTTNTTSSISIDYKFKWAFELGYRWYSGRKGASGFFVGPTVYLAKCDGSLSIQDTVHNQAHTFGLSISPLFSGAALDLGGQFVADNGFTLGITVGPTWFYVKEPVKVDVLSKDVSYPKSLINEFKAKYKDKFDNLDKITNGMWKVWGRLLINIGWSF